MALDSPFENSGFTQLHIINEMHKHYFATLNDKLKTYDTLLSERSPHSAKVFTNALFRCGYINQLAYELLTDKIFDSIEQLGLKTAGPNKLIFIDAPGAACHERIVKRQRVGKEKLLLMASYLKLLKEECCVYVET